MLVVAACTAANPAYESTSETADAEPGSSVGETAGPGTTTELADSTDGTTRGEATGEHDDTADEGGSSSTGDVPGPLPIELCRFDLYAINEVGELHVLDPDIPDAVLLLQDPRLASWAIATDPVTGLLYVNEKGSPSTMWRVDPFTLEIDDAPLVIEVEEPALDDVARATFHENGDLWIGTHETHRFVWVPLSGGSMGGDQTLEPFPQGGDMVFIDGSCAVVPTLDGSLYRVCFPSPDPVLPMITVVDMPVGSQFTGIAIDAMNRLWLSDPDRLLVRIERDVEPWTAVQSIPYGLTINDLAPVVHPPDCGRGR